MAAVMLLILCVDTFATGLLVRHVIHLGTVIAQQGEHIVAVAGELQVQEDELKHLSNSVEG